jgi:hypothetical protein
MRISIKAGRRRVLAITAGVLLCGAALATATVPAQAVLPPPPPPNPITLSADPGAQLTDPIGTAVPLEITATETNQLATLTFTVTSAPTGPFTFTDEPKLPGNATADLNAAFTKAYAGTVTVTVSDDLSTADTVSEAFTWTAKNTVTVTNPGTQKTIAGTAVDLHIAAKDNGVPAPAFTAGDTLPPGLAINKLTGVITGKPATAGTYPVTITATDSTGSTGATSFTWTVAKDKIDVTAPKAKATWLGLQVSVRATATDSGKSQTIKWSAKPLPPGLSISKTGLISGRTKATGLFKTIVTATDGTGAAGTATIDWNVGTPITVSSPGAVTTTAGHSVAYKLAYRDAVPGDKVKWTATGLPAGVGFQQGSLLLYGWPATAGTRTVVFKAKGSLGTSDQKVLKLVVKAAPDKGAAGQLRLALDGKCLLDPGNHTANGTSVKIGGCVPGATERWTVASDNTLRVNGRCLDISGTRGANGKQLALWSCTGAAREVWLQGSAGELVNPASGLCVTDPGSSKKNGIVPTMGACHPRPYEQWTLPAQPIGTSIGDSCADDPLGLGENGTVIDMFTCNGTAGQAWDFEPNGTIKISQYSTVCLEFNKSKPELWRCNASDKSQRWTVKPAGGLGSELTVGGACLAVKSLTSGNTAKLVMAKCAANNPLDLWHIE